MPEAGCPASLATWCFARKSIHLLLASESAKVEWAPTASGLNAFSAVQEAVESEGAAMEVVEALLPPVQSVALPLPPQVPAVHSNPALIA